MNLIYGIKDKPRFGQVVLFAIQQLLAIMAATIAVPSVVNSVTGSELTASAAIFGAGIGTIVYLLFTKSSSPVFLGSSFAFLGSMFSAFAGAATSGLAQEAGYWGFIIGAVSMLVSNIYFGQGAWTPWQMFAAGVIGFLAGVLFRKGLLCRSRGAMCFFGFTVTVALYGGIMNFSSLVLSHIEINRASLAAFYAQGLPYDIIHAFSTVVFLFFFAEPMLEKLDRVKTKYGIPE